MQCRNIAMLPGCCRGSGGPAWRRPSGPIKTGCNRPRNASQDEAMDVWTSKQRWLAGRAVARSGPFGRVRGMTGRTCRMPGWAGTLDTCRRRAGAALRTASVSASGCCMCATAADGGGIPCDASLEPCCRRPYECGSVVGGSPLAALRQTPRRRLRAGAPDEYVCRPIGRQRTRL